MAKEFSKSFYSSAAWQTARHAYIMHRISIDGGLCERCHSVPGYIVHHKEHLAEDNMNNPCITIDQSNLMYVCKQCHDIIHEAEYRGREPKAKRYEFDENGNIIPIVPRTPPPFGGKEAECP